MSRAALGLVIEIEVEVPRLADDLLDLNGLVHDLSLHATAREQHTPVADLFLAPPPPPLDPMHAAVRAWLVRGLADGTINPAEERVRHVAALVGVQLPASASSAEGTNRS